MQPAARVTDMHVCPLMARVVPRIGGTVVLGCFTMMIR